MTGSTTSSSSTKVPLNHANGENDALEIENASTHTENDNMQQMASQFRHSLKHSLDHWGVLALGQGLSFLLACSGAAQATLHLDCQLSAPTFATGIMYLCLTFLVIPWYFRERRILTRSDSLRDATEVVVCRQEEESSTEQNGGTVSSPRNNKYHRFPRLHTPAWAYFLIALLDVEANYLTVLAFRFTTLTSVTIFDALAIPSAMVCSRIFLKRKYVPVHLIGAVICMVGIVVNVFTDYESDEKAQQEDDDVIDKEKEEYPHRLLGDFLAILGGLVYGANNVLQEYMVKGSGGPLEFLCMLGFFGMCISIVQVLILERNDVADFFETSRETCDTTTGILLLMGYVASLSVGYVGGSYFLVISEAALLNLSLLTGDLWSVVFSIVAERIVPSWLFFVALTLIVSGVLLYETGPSPIVPDQVDEQLMTSSNIPTHCSSGDLVDVEENLWRYDSADDNELELAVGELS